MSDDLLARFEAFVPRYVAYVKSGVSRCDLTPKRLAAMRRIAEGGGETNGPGGAMMSDVARALGVTPYAVTKIVDTLEEDRLVTRRAHSSDRRVTLLALTPSGELALEEGDVYHAANMERMLAVLTDEERKAFSAALDKLTDFVDSQG